MAPRRINSGTPPAEELPLFGGTILAGDNGGAAPMRRIGHGPPPPQHRPTSLAPQSLMNASPALRQGAAKRAASLESELRPFLGQPYYCRGGFVLYRGDCVERLRRLHQSRLRVDLIITSPPYNIGKEYERPLALDEYVSWCREWMSALHSVTIDGGAFWLNLGYAPVQQRGRAVPLPYLLWDKSPYFLQQEVVWQYGAGVSTKRSFCPRNEKWLFYTKDVDHYCFNLDDVRDPDVKYPNQKKNGKFRCNPLGKNPSDVWSIPKVTSGAGRMSKERTRHPAQFPIAVVDRIAKVSSNPRDIILDPFGGSGSTGLAAVGNGRVFVGFELREDYCGLAADRFEQFLSASDSQRGLDLE